MMKEFSFFLFTLNILIPKYKKTAWKAGACFPLFCCFLMVMSSCYKNQEFVSHTIVNASLSLPKSMVVKKEWTEDSRLYSINTANKHIGYIYYGDYKPFVEDNYMITVEPEIFEKFKNNREFRAYFSDNSDRYYRNGVFNVNYYY
ncbi:hypothetical protein [Chryseobacterium sp. CBTAP 102]|uniref:hypothetical protein n=1 Tax=Chryseobacterium sp. CBTAP 102 TaxID=2135644 RepID=UPI000D76AC9E|nr:hypothetical protein [Chryseobacterium sp. CBTAP 102]